ncbi:hypothetical protein C8D88_102772 [Lentzea atacamensis]|uniref:SMODS-associated and fused to various effectors domain-containing protein n=2 Tax=Lentzea atacamensis TaxID=531938 RepID=A0A316IGZ9_9PSEU|nr:hypothetical protein C8D88_102772 [Lentzea atacamensis]
MCNRYLVDEEFTGQNVMVGQLAHIVGWSPSPGSPRGSDPLDVDQRNLADNLMLLCHDQHKVIDDKSLWDTYDTETLRSMKRKHEQRIRRVTALKEERKTTVLRVVGNLHGRPVELDDTRVITALLERDRFPDWTLRGADEFEVDLRAIPGEDPGTPHYWAAARAHLEDRLGYLRTQVRKGQVTHLSVFALARIPVLILLGTMLDETLPTELYPKRRDGSEGWGWSTDAAKAGFTFNQVRAGADNTQVAVMLSVSGTVDRTRLAGAISNSCTLYELTPEDVTPAPALISTASTLDRFSQTWRALLATIEIEHPGARNIAVFPAVPAAAAVSMGRHLMRVAHPPLRIFDRVQGFDTYQFTTSTASADEQKGDTR